jgi:hypothetical protein
MTKLVTSLLVLAASLSAQSSSTGAKISCPEETWDFGSVPQQQELKHVFKIRNVGDDVLDIRQVIPSCQCAAAMPKKNRLAPGEETGIDVTMKTLSFTGRIEKVITVVSNDRGRPQLRLNVSGEVLPPYYVKPSELNFGKFSKSDPSKEIPFKVVTLAGTQIEIKEVVPSSGLLTVRPTGDVQKRADGSNTHSYVAQVKSGATVGLMRENVTVVTDHKKLMRTIIPVTADVAGEVLLSLQNLNFGLCKPGQEKSKELVVNKSGAADLEILGVDVLPTGRFDAVVEEIEKGRKFKVRVSLRKDAAPGYLKGSVNIRTNCSGEKTVRAWFHAFVSKK